MKTYQDYRREGHNMGQTYYDYTDYLEDRELDRPQESAVERFVSEKKYYGAKYTLSIVLKKIAAGFGDLAYIKMGKTIRIEESFQRMLADKNLLSISGETFVIKDSIKMAGFRWNKEEKSWERR